LFVINVNSIENKIVLKIDNEIITSLDIENEIIYLKALNPSSKKLDKKKLQIIAKNSLIREKIKEIEILKYVETIKLDRNFLEQLIKERYSRLNLNNEEQFLNYLKSFNIDLDVIKEKISIEAVWNQLIYQKYSSKVKIDKNNLEAQIEKVFKKGEKIYLLSEIVFKLNDKKKLEEVNSSIKEAIIRDGFESAALTFSISDSAQLGGKLGWVKESSLNNKIKKLLSNLNINEITKPLFTPNGYILLKIDNIDYKKIEYDKKKELNDLIRVKTNQQLNQYSNIYFSKVKKDTNINEF
jgi:peptidyl-prolyl cis-trans isomerase SurA